MLSLLLLLATAVIHAQRLYWQRLPVNVLDASGVDTFARHAACSVVDRRRRVLHVLFGTDTIGRVHKSRVEFALETFEFSVVTQPGFDGRHSCACVVSGDDERLLFMYGGTDLQYLAQRMTYNDLSCVLNTTCDDSTRGGSVHVFDHLLVFATDDGTLKEVKPKGIISLPQAFGASLALSPSSSDIFIAGGLRFTNDGEWQFSRDVWRVMLLADGDNKLSYTAKAVAQWSRPVPFASSAFVSGDTLYVLNGRTYTQDERTMQWSSDSTKSVVAIGLRGDDDIGVDDVTVPEYPTTYY